MDKGCTGRVISHLGRGLLVMLASPQDTLLLCQPRRKLETVAVGDQVVCEQVAEGQGVISEILPRRTLLSRPGRSGRSRPVAANLDQVIIVFASEPACDCLLIDQYLAYCEVHALEAVLAHNKCDLGHDEQIAEQMATYTSLGYPLMHLSATHQTGMPELLDRLHGKTSILVGQSGVGKSSLTKQLIGDQHSLRINTLSETTRHGRHTTTTATLYPLAVDRESFLIDSPGVAIFGLDNFSEDTLASGYREFIAEEKQCRFNDCRHEEDKGCAIREAVEAGRISSDRYQRYIKLKGKLPRRNF